MQRRTPARRPSAGAASSTVVESHLPKRGRPAAADLHPGRIIGAIEAGLPVEELDALQECLGVPLERLASLLGISKATLHRRKAEGRLDRAESDRVVRFARLAGQAAQVLEGAENGRLWLSSPQHGLAGAIPLEYAATEAGARVVEDLLGRLEHGVYA